ncbi:GAF and ANTAR domain-containing protein [Cryobacterium sp. PAMC25264]|uniref:GAF and ANTAR domain-containing protein n=1 Tax=Cryobacterium sp. PAMC25264 TaxID=2861288 RepID=UPI001C631547|nr:GAF and ANTAR domain-containing protein [Cryobacterium sp. PAMC25264]QYF74369.1 GAF and ANTAR domain-containing protein [Cryobacterium sp. PAMC25264]
MSDLGVTGASITVVVYRSSQATVCASDRLAARIDSLQLELGEGPHWEVATSRSPVLCPNLAVSSPATWPIFLPAARELGVGALFCFPMLLGAALVGVVDLYCIEPRPIDRDFTTHASYLAGRVASSAVQKALHAAEHHDSHESETTPSLRREVHQATGMIISQLDVGATEAFARMQAYAFATGSSIDSVAHQIVTRTLRFDEVHS